MDHVHSYDMNYEQALRTFAKLPKARTIIQVSQTPSGEGRYRVELKKNIDKKRDLYNPNKIFKSLVTDAFETLATNGQELLVNIETFKKKINPEMDIETQMKLNSLSGRALIGYLDIEVDSDSESFDSEPSSVTPPRIDVAHDEVHIDLTSLAELSHDEMTQLIDIYGIETIPALIELLKLMDFESDEAPKAVASMIDRLGVQGVLSWLSTQGHNVPSTGLASA